MASADTAPRHLRLEDNNAPGAPPQRGSVTSVQQEEDFENRASFRVEVRPNGAPVVWNQGDAVGETAGDSGWLVGENKTPLVDRVPWCAFLAVEVSLNLVVLGIETDFKCLGANCTDLDRLPWQIVDYFFTFAFLIDVVIAIVVLGPSVYFRGDRQRNRSGIDMFRCLDLIFVLSRVADIALMSAGVPIAGVKLLSMFRIMHLARLARKLHSMHTFRELWLIMEGMRETMRCLMFVVFLMLIVLFVFGTAATILKGKEPKNIFTYHGSFDKDDYWGTVPKSMLTLFQVFTKDRWGETVTRPLIKEDWGMAFFFVAFLVLTTLALSTTIVGVIVESTLSSAKANEEKKNMEKEKLEGVLMRNLEQIFIDADTDQSGDLDIDELHAAVELHEVRQRLKILDISVADLDLLFILLDEDGHGAIRTSQFFKGCSRLRGQAMARDLSHMKIDLDRYTSRCQSMGENIQSANDSMARLYDSLEELDRDIIKAPDDVKDPVLQARRKRAPVKADDLRLTNKITEEYPSEFTDDGMDYKKPKGAANYKVCRGQPEEEEYLPPKDARWKGGERQKEPKGRKSLDYIVKSEAAQTKAPWKEPPPPPETPPELTPREVGKQIVEKLY